jgi:pimeloyl-ACP methyl ester carboxylesterase
MVGVGIMETVRSSDGTTIAFERSGDGPPLVYVGGALNDRHSGAPLAARLAPRFTVVTYDRRGRGDSGDTAPFDVGREIDDLAAVLDAAGGSAAVYGMSSGGALALEASARGLAITRLAVFEVPFNLGDEASRERARNYRRDLVALLDTDRRDDALALFMRSVGMPAEAITGMRTAPMWPALAALAPTLAYDSAVMRDAEGASIPVDRLSKITVPTLVLDGGASPEWMRETARAVARALPHGEHHTLEGQTHDVAADALAPVLEDFLAAPGSTRA